MSHQVALEQLLGALAASVWGAIPALRKQPCFRPRRRRRLHAALLAMRAPAGAAGTCCGTGRSALRHRLRSSASPRPCRPAQLCRWAQCQQAQGAGGTPRLDPLLGHTQEAHTVCQRTAGCLPTGAHFISPSPVRVTCCFPSSARRLIDAVDTATDGQVKASSQSHLISCPAARGLSWGSRAGS